MTDVRIHRKRDGLLMIAADGSARFLTLWESLMYRLFNRIPAR